MKIGISQCLAGVCCTYKGTHNQVDIIKKMYDQGDVVSVCPEVLGGLPTPRCPSEIQAIQPLSVINQDGDNVTKEYLKGAYDALNIFLQEGVDVALLKARSPSCGKDEIYDGTFSHTIVHESGVFAKLCQEQGIKVFHEEELEELIKYIREDEFYGTYFKNETSV